MYLTLGSGPSITTNNTEVLITDIGDDVGRPPLTCHTDLTTCCKNSDNNGNGPLGQWTYPDGSVVLNNGGRQQFYINRNAPQLIRLNRRVTNPLTPTGSYCCTVPTTGGDMTLCANLGEWIAQWSLYPISPSHMQWCVCPSLPPPMEGSPTLTKHWVRTLWPLTPVTLATLSLEVPPGSV